MKPVLAATARAALLAALLFAPLASGCPSRQGPPPPRAATPPQTALQRPSLPPQAAVTPVPPSRALIPPTAPPAPSPPPASYQPLTLSAEQMRALQGKAEFAAKVNRVQQLHQRLQQTDPAAAAQLPVYPMQVGGDGNVYMHLPGGQYQQVDPNRLTPEQEQVLRQYLQQMQQYQRREMSGFGGASPGQPGAGW